MTGIVGNRLRDEDRDESSGLSEVYRSGEDDDVEEPWDEPPALTTKKKAPVRVTSPLLACVEEYFDPAKEEEEVLDDGDLPSLSSKKKPNNSNNSTLLNGKTSTRRPLQAPSKAGLDNPTEPPRTTRTRDFWNQFEAPSADTMVHEKSRSRSRSKTRSESSWDEDAPDDEMGDLRGKEEEMSPQPDEYEDREEIEGVDQFCDVSDMLTNMCGEPTTESPERNPMLQRKRQLKPINDIPMGEDPVEEQTAIEVEYVEPEPAPQWSPAKKNSYLAAMARKAKTEFNKNASVPEEKKSEEPEKAPDKDVYSSLNATEKRKFLRMVNSGMTPTESANKIKEEREASAAAKSAKNDKGKRNLAFWKKQTPKQSAKEVAAPATKTERPSSPEVQQAASQESPVRVTVGSQSKKSPFNLKRDGSASPGRRKRDPPASPGRIRSDPSTSPGRSKRAPDAREAAVVFPAQPKREINFPQSKRDAAAQSKRDAAPTPENGSRSRPMHTNVAIGAAAIGGAAVAGAAIASAASDGSDESDGSIGSDIDYDAEDDIIPGGSDDDEDDEDGTVKSRNAAAAAGSVAGAAAVATTAAIIASNDSSESELDIQERFAKSGSSYYDAVRREPQVEVADRSVPASKTKPKRSRSVAKSPKQPAFSVLSEREEKNKTNAIKADLEATKVKPKIGKGDASRSRTLSPESSASNKRRFRLRGARSTGFAALQEDDHSVENKPNNHSIAIGAAAMGTAAAAGTTAAIVLSQSSESEEEEKEEIQAYDTMPELEEDDAERLEKDLLRPMGIAGGAAVGGLTVRTILEGEPDYADDSNFDIASPQSLAVTPRGQAVDAGENGLLSLDNYLDSATTYSSPQDQMSVVSGKSHWTAATGVSNYTTSSRVRRPGAAKRRLAKAKKTDSVTKKGWHESIKKAAANSNQPWDPKQGFADYQDNEADMIDEVTGELLHLDLKAVARKTRAQNDADDENSEAMPTVVYQEDRETLNISEHSLNDQDLDETQDRAISIVPARAPPSLTVSPAQPSRAREPAAPISHAQSLRAMEQMEPVAPVSHGYSSRAMSPISPVSPIDSPRAAARESPVQLRPISPSVDDDDDRPKGWLETMKIATAKIAKNGVGPTWDPENGWQGIEENTAVAPDNTKLDPPPSPSPARSVAPDPDGLAPALLVPGVIGATTGVTAMASQPTNTSNERDMQPRSLEEDLDAAEPHAVDPPPDVVRRTFEISDSAGGATSPIVGASDASVISRGDTVNEKYVQIGDTGSVRSYTYNQSPSEAARKKKSGGDVLGTITSEVLDEPVLTEEDIVEDDTAPLLAAGNTTFAKSTDAKSPEVVNVVKQKNTEDDINLFAHDSRTSFASPESLQKSPPTTRRGFGPVDIDEIDDMDFDDDDDDDDAMWASDQRTKSAAVAATTKPNISRKVNPAPRIVETAKPKSVRKVSPTPPKLVAPRKDTSPIRERKKRAAAFAERQQEAARADPVGKEAVITNSIRAADAYAENDENYEEYEEESREDPVGSHAVLTQSIRAADSLLDYDEESHEDSVGRKNKNVGVSPFREATTESEDNSASVKKMAQQWETRGKSYDELDHVMLETSREADDELSLPEEAPKERSPAGTAEWKSFLGKKVQAESAAAAKQELVQLNRPDRTEESHGRDVEHSNRRDDEVDGDDDSVFDFKPSMSDQAGAFPTRVDSRPDDVDDNFSEISPIQYEDDEVESIHRMESVSDTGTNVEQGSFFKRLQACAAPIMPRQFSGKMAENGDSVPSAHLAFMRTNQSPNSEGKNRGSSPRFNPPDFCGRPDTIKEDGEAPLPSTLEVPLYNEYKRSSSNKKSRPRSSPKSVGSDARSAISDEGFGARTSYLEAVAMKAAVSKPKRNSSRGRASDERSSSRGRASDERSRSSAMSDISTGSRRSERWQEFLDRKSAGVTPEKSRSSPSAVSAGKSEHSSEISKAAEKYAAQQVEQMMAAMSNQHTDVKQRQVDGMISPGAFSPNSSGGALPPYEMNAVRSDGSKPTRSVKRKNNSARAAEELAAARVEAMMAAMTSQTLDEGEI